jgi:mRNA interferase RelE/StbE
VTYQIIIPKAVEKELDGLPSEIRERMLEKIASLMLEPRPSGVVKLKGYENQYRVRIGSYRVR